MEAFVARQADDAAAAQLPLAALRVCRLANQCPYPSTQPRRMGRARNIRKMNQKAGRCRAQPASPRRRTRRPCGLRSSLTDVHRAEMLAARGVLIAAHAVIPVQWAPYRACTKMHGRLITLSSRGTPSATISKRQWERKPTRHAQCRPTPASRGTRRTLKRHLACLSGPANSAP